MNNGHRANNKPRIMIADDDPAILDATSMILQDEGYAVEVTSDCRTLRGAAAKLPDLLLLDIWMSGLDGRDICKFVKEHKRTRHIPVIMISANRDTEKIAKESGAEDFIAKPFDIDELLQKVKMHLKN